MSGVPTDWRARGRRLLRAARAGLKQVVRSGGDEVFRPDYSDAALIAAIARNPSAAAAVPLREALREWETGAHAKARRRVVEHFDRQTRLRFFFDTADASALAETLEQISSGWRERVTSWTTRATTEALAVYAHPAAPLKPGFPWAGKPFAESSDSRLYAVRPHRFAFAPTLACATLVGHPPASGFKDLLADWCRFAVADRTGLAFMSTLVVAQRLIACSWTYAMLGPATEDRREAFVALKWHLLKLMGQDIACLRPRLGTSYPNNHLLVDRFMAWYIAVLLPELGSAGWTVNDANVLWLRECEKQTYPDGGYFEPSVRYQGMATELLAAYVLLGHRQSRPLSPWVEPRLEAMLRFQARLAGADGQPPEIGDGTEDSMLPLIAEARSAPGLAMLHRTLYADGLPPASGPNPGKEWAFWMVGGRVPVPKQERQPATFAAFPHAGVYVFSEDDESTRFILRTAPAPDRQVSPGHMHSDLMSIYLVQSGTPLIVDSGTFTYRFGDRGVQSGGTNWRAYLAGASAHSTVLIAAKDPLGTLTGDFRSSERIPRALALACRASSRLAVAAARLDASPPYAGLVRGALHVFDEYFLVWNVLPPDCPPGSACFLFQLAPGTEIRAGRGHLHLDNAGTSVDLVHSSGLEAEASKTGADDPPAGWVSPRYGELLPAPQVPFRGLARISALVLRRSDKQPVSSIAHDEISDGSIAVRIEGAGFSDLVVLNLGPSRGAVSMEQGSFDGEVLWVRESAVALELRSLATRQIRLHQHSVTLTSGPDRQDFEYSKQL